MSSDYTSQQVGLKQPGPIALRKIHCRIDNVKFILQKKDEEFYNKHSCFFEQLKEPKQRFIDTINLVMDNGAIKTIKLILVQHNLAFGPGKGRLKFIKHVSFPEKIKNSSLHEISDIVEKQDLEEVEASATGMSLYNALHNVKLGGASSAVSLVEFKEIKDQIQIIPLYLTKIETAKLSREIGSRLVKYLIMSPDGFWPGPDGVNTEEQVLEWVEDGALKTLLLRHLLAPKDNELLETLNKVHAQQEEKKKARVKEDNAEELLETPYHDAALMWLKEWKATKRGEMAIEELESRTSKVGKQYRHQILRTALKYRVMPSVAKDIVAVKRLLTVMHLPFRDYKPDGRIVILDTGIAPAIAQENLSKLKELYREDIVIISVLSKRLGGSSPKKIEQLCRIYAEAAYNLGAKIVLLCNTMDANARDVLDKDFSIPILGPIGPAVKAALRLEVPNGAKQRKIGIIATKATTESGAYISNIRNHAPEVKVFSVVAPLLATMVDMGAFDKLRPPSVSQKAVSVLEANIRPLMKKGIDTLILGCTHYGVFKQAIHDIWKRCTDQELRIVDSSMELSHYTLEYLKQNKLLSFRLEHKGTVSRMASEEDTQRFKQRINEITGRVAEVKPMDIGEVVGRLSEEDRLFQETVSRESKEDINLRGIIINSDLSCRGQGSYCR